MNASQHSILLSLVLLLAFPATSESEDGDETYFIYPREAENELLVARRTWDVELCDRRLSRVETYRVFGDGRMEIDPLPDWLQEEKIVLEPEVMEHLLHSVDALIDLGAHHLAQPEAADSFVEVHLDRYVSPAYAIYYLDARVVSGLDAVFEELATLERWLVLRAAGRLGRGVWVSGNPWPLSCQEKHRRKLGHRVLEPAWCGPPAFWKSAAFRGPSDGDDAAREAVRERLRERLRALPRGLPDSSSSSDCGRGHTHSIKLESTYRDP